MTNEFAAAIAEQIERLVDAKLRQHLESSRVLTREDIVEIVQDEVRYRMDDLDLTDAVRDVLMDARIEV